MSVGSLRNYYDLNWMVRNFGHHKQRVEDGTCDLESHLTRRTSLLGGVPGVSGVDGFGAKNPFMCNACKAMSYYACSDWKNGKPFYMNGDQWSLTIYPSSEYEIHRQSSRRGIIPEHMISYVCGDKYVVLRKHGVVTKNLTCTKQIVSKVAKFLFMHKTDRLWCNSTIDNFIIVDNNLYLKNVRDMSMIDENGRCLKYKRELFRGKLDNMFTVFSPKNTGFIFIREMNECMITSMFLFTQAAMYGDIEKLGIKDYSVINFYNFVLSAALERKRDEYLNKLLEIMFRRSELADVLTNGTLEGVTMKMDIFDTLVEHGFLS